MQHCALGYPALAVRLLLLQKRALGVIIGAQTPTTEIANKFCAVESLDFKIYCL